MSVDKIISFIKDTSEDDKALDNLHSELNKESVREAMAKAREKIEAALPALSPQKNSLGLIHLLYSVTSNGSKYDRNVVVKVAQDLIVHGSIKQIRLDAKKFGFVCRKYVAACRELKQPMRAIKPLKMAMNKISSNPDLLTPQHSQFLLACISAKCYKTALPVLDHFVFQIDPQQTGVTSEDTRTYYYYGGVCYVAMKQWQKALDFFELVIAAPAMMPSAVMVEAYKKFVLVSLILKGSVGSLPKSANMSLVRVFKQFAHAYEQLAVAFSTHSVEDIDKVIESNGEPYTKDGNLGLVLQVKRACQEQTVNEMTLVYSTRSIATLQERTGIKDANELHALLLRMVETRAFPSRVHQKQGYVEFQDVSGLSSYNTDETLGYLREHIHATVHLHKKTAEIDRSIEKSHQHVQKTLVGDKFGDDRGEMAGMHALTMGAF